MPRIESIYAFVVEDASPDDEGVIAMQSRSDYGEVLWLPLVGADMARVESLKPIARGIGNQIGKKVKLVHFTNREELGFIN